MKTCTKCKQLKSLDNFHKDKSRKDNLHCWCKDCVSKKDHNFYIKNREKIKINTKKWSRNNPQKTALSKKKWLIKNPTKRKIALNKYIKNNPGKQNLYNIERRKTDICFRLICNIRSRLCSAIKRNQKSGSAVKDLGCSVKFLKKYLESQFKPDMSWENYGKCWHIDHIIPLSSFDLTNREELLKACHYTNLQPLWAEENLSKSNKIDI